jgi:hypothetical protein
MYLLRRRLVAAGLGFTLATAATTAFAAGFLGNRGSAPQPHYPRNAGGQTYGSQLESVSPATDPDLIEAIATNGAVGYVRSKDLNVPLPSTPEAALAQAQASMPRSIPVYAQDGQTGIGAFVVGAGSVVAGTVARAP